MPLIVVCGSLVALLYFAAVPGHQPARLSFRLDGAERAVRPTVGVQGRPRRSPRATAIHSRRGC
jgi:hypothetical protein